jgi:hypothetical protein
MTTAGLRASIELIAPGFGLDPNLVEAVVLTESGGVPWAYNPEPPYRYLVDVRTGRPFRPLTTAEIVSEVPPLDFPCLGGARDQEWWGQQASWGLMQVMGAVAREHGFRGVYLTELCAVATGLHYGCKHLAAQLAWARGHVNKALGAYNAGRGGWDSELGRAYIGKVRANLAQVQRA